MRPPEINEQLERTVIGQREVLRYVSVAIFKHLQGEPYGNLIMIGSSGTGKTTVMRAVERFYAGHEELHKYRVVVIINANTFANDEGVIDTSRLFVRLEERARRLLGEDATPEEIGLHMQHATVCLDEIDKVSSVVGGKPYVTGINIQQALLTLIEGEIVDWPISTSTRDGRVERVTVHIDTSRMLFFGGGAFEALYDQVFKRVISPTSRVKLPTETVIVDDRVQIREYFTLRHHFRPEDLFDYGMQPQFLARFDNAIILEDLSTEMLERIFMLGGEGLFHASQQFFRRYEIDLRITDAAVRRLAVEAARSARIGARALKGVYAKVIKPFEFDPFSHEEVRRRDDGVFELTIEEDLVRKAVRPELTIPV